MWLFWGQGWHTSIRRRAEMLKTRSSEKKDMSFQRNSNTAQFVYLEFENEWVDNPPKKCEGEE